MNTPVSRRILVFGSLNIDLVQRVRRLPLCGETLSGADLITFTGGKGANQSCAVARLGGRAFMAGVVGSDSFADGILGDLQSQRVDTSFVRRSSKASGTAIIFVLPDGNNSIVISPGANRDVGIELADQAIATLARGDILLCQLEVPLDAVDTALSLARARGVLTILDPAPACNLSTSLLRAVDILTPNQSEASSLLGWRAPVATVEEARVAAATLQARGPRSVVVKLGDLGCLVHEAGDSVHIPAIPGDIVDTTAAGDTFNGAMAVALQEGLGLIDGARFAVAAASLSVRRPGAAASIPSRAEVDEILLG
jgi:ribokinase